MKFMVAASKAMSDFARAAIFYLIGNSYQIKALRVGFFFKTLFSDIIREWIFVTAVE